MAEDSGREPDSGKPRASVISIVAGAPRRVLVGVLQVVERVHKVPGWMFDVSATMPGIQIWGALIGVVGLWLAAANRNVPVLVTVLATPLAPLVAVLDWRNKYLLSIGKKQQTLLSGIVQAVAIIAFVIVAGPLIYKYVVTAPGKETENRDSVSETAAFVSLNCVADTRAFMSRTVQKTYLPPNVVYIKDASYQIVTSDDPPTHDVDGSLFQLSGEEFLRCKLTGLASSNLSNLSVTFVTRSCVGLVEQIGTTGCLYPPTELSQYVAVRQNAFQVGKPFEFALVNFGSLPMTVEGAPTLRYSDNIDSEPAIQPLHLESNTRDNLRVTLFPSRKKASPWKFLDKCTQITRGVPSVDSVLPKLPAVCRDLKHSALHGSVENGF
jgi:hypothetical protein